MENIPRRHADMSPEDKEEATRKLSVMIESALGLVPGRLRLSLLGVPGMSTKSALNVKADPPLSPEEEAEVLEFLTFINGEMGGSPIIQGPPTSID